MKISSATQQLIEAVSSVARATDTAASAPAGARGVKVDVTEGKVNFQATNGELSMSVTVDAETDGNGQRVIPGKLLETTLKTLTGDTTSIDFGDLATSQALITSGPGKVRLNTIDATSFPAITFPAEGGTMVVADDLFGALRRVVPAASTDAARQILTGVLLNATDAALEVVATDSFRLALQKHADRSGFEGGRSVLVPAKALAEVMRVFAKAEKVSVIPGQRNVAFTDGSAWVLTRLLEGEYPKYANVIPKTNPVVAQVQAEELLTGIRIAGVTNSASQVTLAFADGECAITSSNSEVGDAEFVVDAKYDAEPMQICFNANYLREGVSLVGGETVEIRMSEPVRPAVLVAPGDDDFLYVIMPIRG